jgi:hypothetical protein
MRGYFFEVINKMPINNTAAIVIIALVVLALFVFVGCGKGKRDNFTRTPFGTAETCQFARSPVDYINKLPNGWQANPHYRADPGSKYQPLENGPIDLYAEERKLSDPDLLWRQYGDNYIGGTGMPYIENDETTRALLRETGDETLHMGLSNEITPRHLNSPFPTETEIDFINRDPFTADHELYGGRNYFVNTQIGS